MATEYLPIDVTMCKVTLVRKDRIVAADDWQTGPRFQGASVEAPLASVLAS